MQLMSILCNPHKGKQFWNRTEYDKHVPPPIKRAAGIATLIPIKPQFLLHQLRPLGWGTTRKKLPQEVDYQLGHMLGSLDQVHQAQLPVRPTGTPGPTSTAGPFHGPSASSGPISAARPFQGANASSGPISAARPFQGTTSSSPTTVRPSGTSRPTSVARPFREASARTANRFMQFISTPGIRLLHQKNIDYNLIK
ncbi:Collagen triple helix repeat [Sesbania bispinosa]|nr:Collagen triple helix repeat [Sesbania bispinosa]